MRRRDLLMAPFAAADSRRPNFVFVLVDDLRFDELGCTGHPFAQTPHADRLAREGANFRNAFATTPLCSPSRGSFLTGQYPYRNGIIDNTNRSEHSHKLITWPRLLHDAGYESAFVGKWHMGNDDSRRPGFDHWVSFPGQGESNDPPLNINGQRTQGRGYITDILSEHAAGFIEHKRDKPFCLYLAHKAIHPNIQQADDGSVTRHGGADDFIVAPRHKDLYAGKTPPRRPNYVKPPTGKPALLRKLDGVPPLAPDTATDDATILNRMRMTKAIDEGLGQLLASLERTGKIDDTVVVFTSDHGYFYGEHCLGPERRLAYEETLRIPLLIRHPRLFRAGSRPDAMTLSIDIAPTMLAAAGIRPSSQMQGQSLLTGKRREDFLVEYYSDTVFERIQNMGYRAVRTERWKYIHYLELADSDELYDLRNDPYEMKNIVASEPRVLGDMRARLKRLSPA